MSDWIDVKKRRPHSPRGEYGKPVLIYPPIEGDVQQVYFGGSRYGKRFYWAGRECFPTHWQPMPKPPSPTSRGHE